MDDKTLQDELKNLLHELEETEPVDPRGNPFSLLPDSKLKKLKKTIEEFSEELAQEPKIRK